VTLGTAILVTGAVVLLVTRPVAFLRVIGGILALGVGIGAAAFIYVQVHQKQWKENARLEAAIHEAEELRRTQEEADMLARGYTEGRWHVVAVDAYHKRYFLDTETVQVFDGGWVGGWIRATSGRPSGAEGTNEKYSFSCNERKYVLSDIYSATYEPQPGTVTEDMWQRIGASEYCVEARRAQKAKADQVAAQAASQAAAASRAREEAGRAQQERRQWASELCARSINPPGCRECFRLGLTEDYCRAIWLLH
jgi:hypothetical protein